MIKGSYSETDDLELVRAVLGGDRSAFSAIVSRYRKMVARTVKGMLNDTVYAEDVGQEVFIKLYYSLSEFRGESKLISFSA